MHWHVCLTVLDSCQTSRQREAVKDDIMLKNKLNIRAIQPYGVVSVSPVDMLWTRESLAKVTTDEVFIA